MKSKQQRKAQGGFSLIEMLVVVSIISILAATGAEALVNLTRINEREAGEKKLAMLEDAVLAWARDLAYTNYTDDEGEEVPLNRPLEGNGRTGNITRLIPPDVWSNGAAGISYFAMSFGNEFEVDEGGNTQFLDSDEIPFVIDTSNTKGVDILNIKLDRYDGESSAGGISKQLDISSVVNPFLRFKVDTIQMIINKLNEGFASCTLNCLDPAEFTAWCTLGDTPATAGVCTGDLDAFPKLEEYNWVTDSWFSHMGVVYDPSGTEQFLSLNFNVDGGYGAGDYSPPVE